ncbi:MULTISPECIES: hypothetical protein [Halorussus]|uniref:hypothetical protein n=1 Tax=Halorussus TaxID=1070314 RepID=UPI000E219C5C|nr:MULTISPECIES: hypothetical protein [Halorussus]NHN57559.1 hypothetical protein [Halorussus sp. JP-T4]
MDLPFVSTADRRPRRGAGTESESTARPPAGLAGRLATGSKAGLVATLVMTAYRLPVSRSLPPTAEFWAKYVSGGDPDDHPVAAVALHLLYGAVGGAVFGALTPADSSRASADVSPVEPAVARQSRKDASRATASREALGLAWGSLYALGLSIFGERVMLGRLLDEELDADERLVFHAGHLVYGLSLGTLYSSRTSEK